MPLNDDIDRSRLAITMVSGGVAAFFHWAAVQTSDKPVSAKRLRGELAASFVSGMAVCWLLAVQTTFTVDPLGAFIAAAIVGFTYGPAGLIIAARYLARRFGLENAADQQFEVRLQGRNDDAPTRQPATLPTTANMQPWALTVPIPDAPAPTMPLDDVPTAPQIEDAEIKP